jgi:hypothetical protein
MTAKRLFFVLCTSLLVTSCAADAQEWLDDSTETETDVALGAADSAASTATHFVARFDVRRCAWPFCGGYWVHRVNRTSTRCADGRFASECYVAELDASAIGLSGDETSSLSASFGSGRAVIEGTIRTVTNGSLSYAVMHAEHGWVAANDAVADDVFYSLEDDGIRCVRAPCFSIDEQKLNSTIDRTISDLDLDLVGLTDAQRDAVGPALSGQGLLATGTNVRNRRTGAVRIVATQVYFPALPAPTSCTSDADCTLTFYPTPVTSEADCYCPGCPSPALVGTASANQASWELYCSATHGIDVCPARPCAPPPPAACSVATGACGFGRPEL